MLPLTVLQLKSPMEVLHSFYPRTNHFLNIPPKIFGCVSFVHVHKQQRGNLIHKHLYVFS